ncbi:hypothetical protein PR048_003229 [Dryococelus australis]|uniref:Uncharacterized protein n=1 Tax=Dryococelus australis TaxID=614101 RepID=A0ABQ9INE8_9NEOP|nr:hypothetical protein PR048_003229 [Dryococelus australis]
MQGRGEREIPEKSRRPAPFSGTIPTCKNPGVNRPGTEPSSPWWKESSLTAQPPRPLRGRPFVAGHLAKCKVVSGFQPAAQKKILSKRCNRRRLILVQRGTSAERTDDGDGCETMADKCRIVAEVSPMRLKRSGLLIPSGRLGIADLCLPRTIDDQQRMSTIFAASASPAAAVGHQGIANNRISCNTQQPP